MKYIALIMFVFTSCASIDNNFPDLKIGKSGLPQEVKTTQLQSGLRHIRLRRGITSTKDFYTVSSGVVSQGKADQLMQKIKDSGFSPRIEFPPENDPHGNTLGFIVRVGEFVRKKEALDLIGKLEQLDINMAIRHTSEDGNPTTGPFMISLMEIDLDKYKGNIKGALGKGEIMGKELTSSISK